MITSAHPRHIFEESPCKSGDAICNLCKDMVSFESNAYYCRECNSYFHTNCLTITYPQSHAHTLTFIRREISVPCDVCGHDSDGIDMYGCLQCDFFVHRECIYLPKVIKITRHSHRLFQTFGISDGENICGVCRYQVDVRYGRYSCIEKTCNYVIHSFCMLKFNVWDGKDVAGRPSQEEVESKCNLVALVEIDGKSIRHFSHDHDLLRLEVEGEEENRLVCQACILPIEFGSFLGCNQCDFALHHVCASLPRKMDHALHVHPDLALHADTMNTKKGFFTCSVCNQHSCGFMYKCCQEDCQFKIDVKCVSFVEPFNHCAHRHPLYLAIIKDSFIYKCYGCNQSTNFAANCSICWFPLDFKCVNLPKLVKFKCDDHPLNLYRDDHPSNKLLPEWWCDICEDKINTSKFVYMCNDCGTTLHVDCILGKYPYLKSDHKIKVGDFEVEIASNSLVSRPICCTCHRICQDKFVFTSGKDVCFCSIDCIQSHSSTKLVDSFTSK